MFVRNPYNVNFGCIKQMNGYYARSDDFAAVTNGLLGHDAV